MDAFVDAWYAIDTDMGGTITIDELRDYARNNNYDDAFVQKWMNLFDSKRTGRIQLEEFCHVLGLEVRAVRAKHVRSGAKTLPHDIILISTDMHIDIQLQVIDLMREAFHHHQHEKDVAKYLKHSLDKHIESLWHVVIVQGQFWCWYSHEPGYSFIFRFGKYIFIIWKTPAL